MKSKRRFQPKLEDVVVVCCVLVCVPALFLIGALVLGICIAWGRYTSGL